MQIASSVLDRIRQHLANVYPAEGCGFLIGVREPGGQVVIRRQIPVINRRVAHGAARTRYVISPDDFRDAERRAAADGLQVVGVYHSHPDVAAQPSAYDREHAWPWFRYLIVSVVGGEVRDERAWELTENRDTFVEHAVQIREE